MSMRSPDNGIQIGQQFKPVKRFRQIAIISGNQRLDLIVNAGIDGNHKDRHRKVVFAYQPRQHCSIAIGDG